jgi:hypothetical protein
VKTKGGAGNKQRKRRKNAGASARPAKNITALLHCCNVRVNKIAEDCCAAPLRRQNKRKQTLSNMEKASAEREVRLVQSF